MSSSKESAGFLLTLSALLLLIQVSSAKDPVSEHCHISQWVDSLIKQSGAQCTSMPTECEGSLVGEDGFILKVQGVDCLELSHFREGKLPEKLETDLTLANLHFEDNRFPYIDETTLNFVDSDVVFLTMENNEIGIIKQRAFHTMKSLHSLRLANSNIREIQPGAFEGLLSLSGLEIISNKLQTLPADLFTAGGGSELITLYLNGNQISNIDKGAFNGLSKLQMLELDKNKLSVLNEGTFMELQTLDRLLLSENQLTSLNTEEFKGLQNLKQLNLSHNMIKTLHPDLFKNTPKLITIDISYNQLTSVEPQLYNTLENDFSLFFRGNTITSINKDMLKPNLVYINLDQNLITSIDDSTFSQSEILGEVNLSHNRLTQIKNKTFTGLLSVKHLDLSDNDIASIDEMAFQDPQQLELLRLSMNNIREISETHFNKLNELLFLNLNANDIVEVHPNAFANNQKLVSIDLSKNSILNLNASLFNRLSSLTSLDLSENKLSDIDNIYFAGLENLQTLKLDNNELTSLHSDMFQFLPQLMKLTLRNNKISNSTMIAKNTFHYLTQLRHIDLSGNKLTDLLLDEFYQVETVYAENSAIRNIRATKPHNNIKYLYLRDNNIKAIELDFMVKLRYLHTLDVRSNKIDTIETGALSGEFIDALHTLLLDDNQLRSLTENMVLGAFSLEKLSINSNLISTIEPEVFSHITETKELYLANNNLKTWTRNGTHIFAKQNNLRKIDLQNNHFTIVDIEPFLNTTDPTKVEFWLAGNKINSFEDIDMQPPKGLHLYFDGAEFTCNCELKEALEKYNMATIFPISCKNENKGSQILHWYNYPWSNVFLSCPEYTTTTTTTTQGTTKPANTTESAVVPVDTLSVQQKLGIGLGCTFGGLFLIAILIGALCWFKRDNKGSGRQILHEDAGSNNMGLQ